MTYEEVKAVMETERNRMGEAQQLAALLEKERTRLYYAKANEDTLRQYDAKDLQQIASTIVELEERQQKLLAPGPEFLKLLGYLGNNPIEWSLLFNYYSNHYSLRDIGEKMPSYSGMSTNNISRAKSLAMKRIVKRLKRDNL